MPLTLGGASDVDKSSTLRNNNKHTACHTTRRTSFKLFRGQILIDFSLSYDEVSLNGLQQPDFSGCVIRSGSTAQSRGKRS